MKGPGQRGQHLTVPKVWWSICSQRACCIEIWTTLLRDEAVHTAFCTYGCTYGFLESPVALADAPFTVQLLNLTAWAWVYMSVTIVFASKQCTTLTTYVQHTPVVAHGPFGVHARSLPCGMNIYYIGYVTATHFHVLSSGTFHITSVDASSMRFVVLHLIWLHHDVACCW